MSKKVIALGGKALDYYTDHRKCILLERLFWNNNNVIFPTRILNKLYDIQFVNNNNIRHNQIKALILENELRKLHSNMPVTCHISNDYYEE